MVKQTFQGVLGNSCPTLNSAGLIMTSTYDNLGSTAQASYNGSNPVISYVYDNNGNIKQLTSNSSGSSVVQSYTYNELHLVEDEVLNVNGKTIAVDYSYNPQGDIYSLKYPDGDFVVFEPNSFGEAKKAQRLARTGRNLYSYATSATYHPNGVIESFTYGNSLVHSTTLNDYNAPHMMTDAKSGLTGLSYGYSYDDNLNITSITDYVNSSFNLSNLIYDGLGRLKSTTGGVGIGNSAITYDGFSNILTYASKNRTLDYTYDSTFKLQNVTSTGTQAKSYNFTNGYDAKGNVINNGIRTFTYDNAGRMTTSGTYSYIYDGHNRRVKVTDSNGVSYSFYSKNGTLLYRETSTGGINYIYLDGKLIAKDGFISESSGKQHSRPFGSSIEGETNDVGYTGHKYDKDLGLVYMQQRYYDPIIGRFYSNDPVGFSADSTMTFNRYAYANNNPYKFTDPDGREVKLQWHEVAFDKNHSLLTITPNNPAHFNNAQKISSIGQLTNSHGQKYGTMGAGPNASLKLESNFNRTNDAAEHSGGIAITLPEGMSEESFVDKLVELDSNYKDNASYSFSPNGTSTFNSNSYVSGLLNAAGVDTSKLNVPNAPGFDKPLPKEAFEAKK